MALLRSVFPLLLLVVALVVEASAGLVAAGEAQWGLARLSSDDGGLETAPTCDGLVGECIDEEEEMGMESESSRRGLAAGGGRGRYISYGALNKNRVPCNRRGHSYYNCRKRGRANPYRRGCSVITRCARVLK